MKAKGQTVQPGEHKQMDRQMDATNSIISMLR